EGQGGETGSAAQEEINLCRDSSGALRPIDRTQRFPLWPLRPFSLLPEQVPVLRFRLLGGESSAASALCARIAARDGLEAVDRLRLAAAAIGLHLHRRRNALALGAGVRCLHLERHSRAVSRSLGR